MSLRMTQLTSKRAELMPPFFLLIIAGFFIVSCAGCIQNTEPKLLGEEWLYITNSDSGLYEVYTNRKSVKKMDNGIVYAEIKLYPSKEYRDKIKREFKEVEEQTLKEFGTKVNGTENLLYNLYEIKTKNYQYRVNCSVKEIQVFDTSSNLLFIIEVKPDTPSEKIYKYLCQQGS
jgi:hypothetical protein